MVALRAKYRRAMSVCIVMYAVIMLHSIIPHDHHMHCHIHDVESEQCDHHEDAQYPHDGSCQMEQMYLLASDTDVLTLLLECPAAEQLTTILLAEESPKQSFEHPSDIFFDSAPPCDLTSRRGPPMA